jgi:SLT domain-containing protein
VHEELKSRNITATSSATGLGQLLLRNVEAYYPSGVQGIGNPEEEAVGMLLYIEDRYGTPDNAWSQYGKHHEGY